MKKVRRGVNIKRKTLNLKRKGRVERERIESNKRKRIAITGEDLNRVRKTWIWEEFAH